MLTHTITVGAEELKVYEVVLIAQLGEMENRFFPIVIARNREEAREKAIFYALQECPSLEPKDIVLYTNNYSVLI